MKRIMLAAMLLIGLGFTGQLNAQFRVSINIGQQPNWGPWGYEQASYYYFPDYQVYYDLHQQQFIYPERNRWIFSASLPIRLGRIDLYTAYKVVINAPRPYLHHEEYCNRYDRSRGWIPQPQIAIRDYYNARTDRYRNDYGDYDDYHRRNEYGNGWGRGNGRGYAYGHEREGFRGRNGHRH